MCFLCCLTLITRRRYVTAAICISTELYDVVQLRSGDGVALPLTLSLTVDVVGLTLRGGGPLIRSNFY